MAMLRLACCLAVAAATCEDSTLLQLVHKQMYKQEEEGDALPSKNFPCLGPGKTALIVVDMQNDFITGSLPVSGGDTIIPVINNLTALKWDFLGYTQDYHPAKHLSFASSSPFNMTAYSSVNVSYNENFQVCGSAYVPIYEQSARPCNANEFVSFEQELWPDHCIQGTYGQKLHPDLIFRDDGFILKKGISEVIDSYGAFFNNIGMNLPDNSALILQKETSETNLNEILESLHIKNVVVLGLAEDYCVKYTSLQSLSYKFSTYLVTDATKAVFPAQGVAAKKAIKDAGGKLIESCTLLGTCACE